MTLSISPFHHFTSARFGAAIFLLLCSRFHCFSLSFGLSPGPPPSLPTCSPPVQVLVQVSGHSTYSARTHILARSLTPVHRRYIACTSIAYSTNRMSLRLSHERCILAVQVLTSRKFEYIAHRARPLKIFGGWSWPKLSAGEEGGVIPRVTPSERDRTQVRADARRRRRAQ